MHRYVIAITLGLSFLLCTGCSSDETEDPVLADDAATTEGVGGDDGSDGTDGVDGLSGEGSFYDLVVVLPSGLQQKLKGEILSETHIAYGSTHIAPAVSLAVNVTYSTPFAIIGLNLGFVKDSNDHAITIEDVGEWAWGTGSADVPPTVSLVMQDNNIQRTFASWTPGASGSYIISQWGTEPGDIIEGTVNGKLVNDGPEAVEATITGDFRIVLPIKK